MSFPVFDLHTDALTALSDADFRDSETADWSLRRFLRGGGRYQVVAVFTPPHFHGSSALQYALEHIERLHRMQEIGFPLRLIQWKEDLDDLPEDCVGVLLGLEGASPLLHEARWGRFFQRLGVRLMGFTWNHRNFFADGVGLGEAAGGLTEEGQKLLKICEATGMAVDLAHLHPRGVQDILSLCRKPPLISHANAYHLKPHPRNIRDDVLREVARRGGIIGVTFVRDFLHAPTVEALAEHLEYLRDLVGAQALALGSDFMGTREPVLPNAEAFPQLAELLLERGWSEEEVRALFAGNALRYFREILPTRP